MTALRDLASKHRAFLAVGFSLGLLLIVCVHWWHAGYVIAQDDSPPMLTPGVWFAKSFGSWSNYNAFFGQVDGEFTFLPYMIVWWIADRIFGADLGQIVMVFVVAAVAWTGAYRLVRSLDVSIAGAIVGAWLYLLNPFTQIVFGHQLTEGIFFALLAWVGVWAVAAALDPTRRGTARLWLTGIAFAALPAIGVTPVLVFQIALDFVVLIALCSIFTADRRAFLRWAAGCAALMVAASLWWVVPDALSFAGASVPHPTALSALDWTYVRSSLLNNLRFLYTWLWGPPEYYPIAPGYDANPLTYAAGFFAVAVSAAGLILLRGRDLLFCRYALGIALVTMFVSKGTHGPLAWVNALFAAVPGAFLVYGDPGGLVALALLVLAMTGALVFDRPTYAYRAPVFIGMLAVIFLSGVDLLNGSVFHGTVVASDRELMPSEYVAVPAYWRSAAEYLNDSPQAGGVLMLPPHLSPGYDVRYDFGYYGSDAVATNLIARRILYLDAGLTGGLSYLKHLESQSLADRLRDLLGSGSPLATAMIRDLGIRYVVYRSDIVQEHYGWYSEDELSALLHTNPKHFGPLAVYDLGAPESVFALRSEFIAGSYGGADAGGMAELAALEEALPRVDLNAVPPDFPRRPVLVERATGTDIAGGVPGVGAFEGAGNGIDRAVRLVPDPADGSVEQPIVVKSAPARTLRVSLGGASAPLVFAQVPLVSAGTTTSRVDLTMLAAHLLAFDERVGGLSLTEEVSNLDRRAVYADVVVPVPEEPARTYALVAAGSRYLATPERNGDSLVMRFRDVLLLPGATTVGLYGTPADVSPKAAAAPDLAGARTGYAFYFTSIRPTGSRIAVGALPDVAVPASFALPVSGSDHASVEVLSGSTPLPALAAAIVFSSGGMTYRCPTTLFPGQEIDLDHVVGACQLTNLLPANVGAARIRSIEILDIAHLPDDGEFLAYARADALLLTSLGSAEMRSGTRGGRVMHGMHWRIDRAPPGIVSLRVVGCAPEGVTDASTIMLDAISGGRRVTYRQRLFLTPDGAGRGAAIDTRRAFANRHVELTGVTASCESDAASGSAPIHATLSLVAPRGTAPVLIPTDGLRTLAVARGGTAEYRLADRGVPLAVRFGDLPPEASVATVGAAPRRGIPEAMACGAPATTCGTGWVRAGIPVGFKGLAVFGQLYSDTWIGIEIGRDIDLPKHVRADGWRNAWFVSEPGTLIVFNAVDVIIFIGLLLGLGVVGWQLRYRRS